jgi:hypothetical protein
VRLAFLLSLSAAALLAQIGVGLPGQYPGQYPPGQYPGQYPPGGPYPGNSGPGIPVGHGRGKRSKDQKSAAPESRNYSGVIRKLDAMSFDLELEDTRFLIIRLSDTTPKPADLKIGAGVDVVATEDQEGNFQAVSIKPNSEIAKTINTNDQLPIQPEDRSGPPPTILMRSDSQTADDNDPGRPKLQRGKPAGSASNDSYPAPPADAQPVALARVERPTPVDSHRAFIEKARGVAATFLQGLPDYVCQEVATRYASETRVPNWNALDVISTDLVYEDGKESYRNLTIDGKPSKKPPDQSGAWSTGEFGTILAALFSPGTDASFRYAQDDTIADRPAYVYDFSVDRLRSNWTVHVPGQYIVSAYKGSVWIDKQSGHALRIEMQGKNIPQEFPLDSVESAVDYDYVSLGTPQKFLLPVRAEILSCQRGSSDCDRNVIEFRNYHKFTGQSTIQFNDK